MTLEINQIRRWDFLTILNSGDSGFFIILDIDKGRKHVKVRELCTNTTTWFDTKTVETSSREYYDK